MLTYDNCRAILNTTKQHNTQQKILSKKDFPNNNHLEDDEKVFQMKSKKGRYGPTKT